MPVRPARRPARRTPAPTSTTRLSRAPRTTAASRSATALRRRPAGALTRRRFLAAGATASGLLVAGCGSSDVAAPAAGTRTVVDLAGRTVEIPADPRRVVVLDPNRVIVDLVALGVEPVGATTNTSNGPTGFAPVLGDVAARIDQVGVTGTADLERVTALAPDLILHATDYQELAVDTLSAIAPVISYPRAPNGLFEPLRWLGGLLGREAEATAAEERLRAAVQDRRAAVGLEGRRIGLVGLLNYDAAGGVVLFGPETGLGELVGLLGGTVVPDEIAGRAVTATVPDLSLELLPDALRTADVVLATRYAGNAEQDQQFEAYRTDPLWGRVPAVARGDIAYLNIQEANGNWGVAGLEAALDALAAPRG